MEVTATILNKQSWRADKEWSSILRAKLWAKRSPPQKRAVFLRNVTQGHGFGWIFWNDLNKGKDCHEIWYMECKESI